MLSTCRHGRLEWVGADVVLVLLAALVLHPRAPEEKLSVRAHETPFAMPVTVSKLAQILRAIGECVNA